MLREGQRNKLSCSIKATTLTCNVALHLLGAAAAGGTKNLSPAPWLGWGCPGSSLPSHNDHIIHAKWDMVLPQTSQKPKADIHRASGKQVQTTLHGIAAAT